MNRRSSSCPNISLKEQSHLALLFEAVNSNVLTAETIPKTCFSAADVAQLFHFQTLKGMRRATPRRRAALSRKKFQTPTVNGSGKDIQKSAHNADQHDCQNNLDGSPLLLHEAVDAHRHAQREDIRQNRVEQAFLKREG